jgi:hypothetical protein
MIPTNGGKCLNARAAFSFVVTPASLGAEGARVCSESLSSSGGVSDGGEDGNGMKQTSRIRAKPASISEYPNIE